MQSKLPKAIAVYHCPFCDEDFNSSDIITFHDLWEIPQVLTTYMGEHSEAGHVCRDGKFRKGELIDIKYDDPHGIIDKLNNLKET
jgi:hypothetical protein